MWVGVRKGLGRGDMGLGWRKVRVLQSGVGVIVWGGVGWRGVMGLG